MQVSRLEHEKIASTFWSIVLVRVGEPPVELGTLPNEDDFNDWFTGAFAAGVLPSPVLYTDELQMFECSGEHKVMRYVWRVGWNRFEAKLIQ
jgi:hypothetical protein